MEIFNPLQKFRSYAGLPPLPIDGTPEVTDAEEATPAMEDAEESDAEEAREEVPPTPGLRRHESSSSRLPPLPSPDAAAGKLLSLYFSAH